MQKHDKEIALFSLSNLLERSVYFGIKALVVIYMLGETIRMPREEALSMYRWFTGLYVVSKILGAVLGDLMLGNKKAIILGGFLQAAGAFALCVPNTSGLYTGLLFILLGSGLYAPNLSANFGKKYLNETKLLDSGFTILYLTGIIGSVTGILLLGKLFGNLGWNACFIFAGLLMIISTLLIFKTSGQSPEKILPPLPLNKRILKIVSVILLVASFWIFYEMTNSELIAKDLLTPLLGTQASFLKSSLRPIIILPLGVAAILIWTRFCFSSFFKIGIAFLSGAISLAFIFYPEQNGSSTLFPLLSLIFLGISEIHLAPLIESVLTKNVNSKYLAIAMSLAFIPARLFSFVFMYFFNDTFYENPDWIFPAGIYTLLTVGAALIIFLFWKQNKTVQEPLDSSLGQK